ncbi:growth arrest and DNA damage-inducible protein GADD45 gamma isoform X2 [Lingula anatina]|uniref:Growth arrest and DNA damage-inducible protein GADD45 gamma isoform X2 n=1 Tax=Lingula anatina TaxID=7574 RepID=A0A1S3J6Z5_LINAN|nr:growth arrest and DNA damage-inducible protein GADD45 gamma isoform X2 [Lingula anatina]|eukprot:XP_013406170.1 growth arrest and DNA damage-inducible protein GADD45 gamma isoform X2 [Lingula anatina]
MTRGNINKGAAQISKSGRTMSPMDIRSALQTCLLEAWEQGRLTCGVYHAASMLEKNPDEVMLCVLADDNFQDVALRIHFTLLEAFCWENDIRVIKVDASSKLANLLGDGEPVNDNDVAAGRSARQGDFSCVLIEYPKDDNSVADEEVLDFYKSNEDVLPRPVITLPD